MTIVIIQCPQTGRYFSTGIEAESFDRASRAGHRTLCPFCQKEHRWTNDEAVLADPDKWSDDPDTEQAFLKAKENADRAAGAKRSDERAFYFRMERKWLGIAEGLRWIAELGRR